MLSSGALTSLASPSCLTQALGSRPAPSYEKACCQSLDAVTACCPGADQAQRMAAQP